MYIFTVDPFFSQTVWQTGYYCLGFILINNMQASIRIQQKAIIVISAFDGIKVQVLNWDSWLQKYSNMKKGCDKMLFSFSLLVQ